MATTETKSIAIRQYLNAAGEECDATDVARAAYSIRQFPERVFYWDVTAQTPIGRAYEADGFLNKMGHAANKRKNRLDMAEALEIVQEEYDAYMRGEWPDRAGGAPTDGLVIEALARLKGRGLEEQKALWADYTDEQKTRARTNAQVQLAVAEIRAERQRAKAEASDDTVDDL